VHALREALWDMYGEQAQQAWRDQLWPEQDMPEFDPNDPF
jgi:hypothetical protein